MILEHIIFIIPRRLLNRILVTVVLRTFIQVCVGVIASDLLEYVLVAQISALLDTVSILTLFCFGVLKHLYYFVADDLLNFYLLLIIGLILLILTRGYFLRFIIGR